MLLLFSSCASMTTKSISITETRFVKQGMRAESAVQLLGRPDKIKKLPDGRVIYDYSEIQLSENSDDTQDFVLLIGADGKIEAAEYGPIINHSSRRASKAAAMKSFGDALAGPQQQRTNCTSTKDYYGNIQTTCVGN